MIVILNFHDVSGQDDKWDITMFHSTSEKKDYAFAASVSSRRLYHKTQVRKQILSQNN